MARKLKIVGIGALLAGVSAVAVLLGASDAPNGSTETATASITPAHDRPPLTEAPVAVDEPKVSTVTERPRMADHGTASSTVPGVFDALMTTATSSFESDMVKALAGTCAFPFIAEEGFAERSARLQASGSTAGRDLAAAVESAYRQGFAAVGGGGEVSAACGVYLCTVEATLPMPSDDDPIWQAVVNRLLGHTWQVVSRLSTGPDDGTRMYRTIFSMDKQWGRISVAARTPAGRETSQAACRSFFPE